MSWMTWEVGNYLYFLPFVLVILVWNWSSLLGLGAAGLVFLSYPFLMPAIGNPVETQGSGGYDSTISMMLWLVGTGLFVLSVIAKAFRIWDNDRRRRQNGVRG